MQHILFFIGKGGVGKSTLSAVNSVALATQGKNVVLASLDPAHNQGDIFGTSFSEKARRMGSGLRIIEMDGDKWIKKYLKKTEKQFLAAYAYLTTFSLEKHFSVIRDAPGIEAYALTMAFEHICDKYPDADYLIFDMPPTALTLSFFALPAVSLLWLDKLLTLRLEIAEKEKIITLLRLGGKTMERDRVIQNIRGQKARWSKLQKIFVSKKFIPVIVKNPDVLSQAETRRIYARLQDLNISKTLTFQNKSSEQISNDVDFSFPFCENLIGLDSLKSYCATLDILKLQKLFEAWS